MFKPIAANLQSWVHGLIRAVHQWFVRSRGSVPAALAVINSQEVNWSCRSFYWPSQHQLVRVSRTHCIKSSTAGKNHDLTGYSVITSGGSSNPLTKKGKRENEWQLFRKQARWKLQTPCCPLVLCEVLVLSSSEQQRHRLFLQEKHVGVHGWNNGFSLSSHRNISIDKISRSQFPGNGFPARR